MKIVTPDNELISFLENISIREVNKVSQRRNIVPGVYMKSCSFDYRRQECPKCLQNLDKILKGEVFYSFTPENELSFLSDDVVFLRLHKKYKLFVAQSPVDSVAVLAERIGEDPALIRRILEEGTDKHYHTFHIWKDEAHTKKRTISAPNEDLKRIQGKILKTFLYKYGVTPESQAFVYGRSIVTNARKHLNQRYLLKMDLKDFFPSITKEMIIGAMYPFFNMSDMMFLELLVDLCCLNGRLPQGAPTSPAISNILGSYLDVFLRPSLAHFRIDAYTRYADDMTFSSNIKISPNFCKTVFSVCKFIGFRLNNSKTRMYSVGMRHKVTGVIVNGEETTIPRTEKMRFRALLHNISTGKTPLTDELKNHIKGKFSFYYMVNPRQALKFKPQMEELSL